MSIKLNVNGKNTEFKLGLRPVPAQFSVRSDHALRNAFFCRLTESDLRVTVSVIVYKRFLCATSSWTICDRYRDTNSDRQAEYFLE